MLSSWIGNNTKVITISVGDKTIRTKKCLDEGAYGYIYKAYDVDRLDEQYAVKHMRAVSEEGKKAIQTELNLLRKLKSKPNIITFYGLAEEKNYDYYLVLELCQGNLLQFLKMTDRFPQPRAIVVKIFGQLCCALSHLHQMDPITIHRDVKLQNLLISADGTLKLCDFGSCTSVIHRPTDSWTNVQHLTVQEDMARHSTPKYRAPEMLETYCMHEISDKADIWACGCVLFELLYGVHPFESAEKMAIVNVQYARPRNVIVDSDQYGLFEGMLQEILVADPTLRPSSMGLYDQCQSFAQQLGANLQGPIFENLSIGSGQLDANPTQDYIDSNPHQQQQSSYSRFQQRYFSAINEENLKSLANNTKFMFDKIKGKAGGLLSNIKTASGKFKASVTTSNSYADRSDRVVGNDDSYLARNGPHSDTTDRPNRSFKNSLPSVPTITGPLLYEFSSKILLVNPRFSPNQLVPALNDMEKTRQLLMLSFFEERPKFFQNIKFQILEIPIVGNKIIPLNEFHECIVMMKSFLKMGSTNTLVLLPKVNSFAVASVLSGIMLVSGFVDSPEEALSVVIRRIKLKHMHRAVPPPLASVQRYLSYFWRCVSTSDDIPSVRSIHMKYAYLSCWPGFKLNLKGEQKLKLKVYCYDVLSFCCSNYQIAANGEVLFFLGTTVFGDVRIEFYIDESSSDTSNENPIFNVSFHTSFVQETNKYLTFEGVDLDVYYYSHINEVSTWTFKLELFPVASSSDKPLFKSNCFTPSDRNVEMWAPKAEEHIQFCALKKIKNLTTSTILITLYHNHMLYSSKHSQSPKISSAKSEDAIDELSVAIQLVEGKLPLKPTIFKLREKVDTTLGDDSTLANGDKQQNVLNVNHSKHSHHTHKGSEASTIGSLSFSSSSQNKSSTNLIEDVSQLSKDNSRTSKGESNEIGSDLLDLFSKPSPTATNTTTTSTTTTTTTTKVQSTSNPNMTDVFVSPTSGNSTAGSAAQNIFGPPPAAAATSSTQHQYAPPKKEAPQNMTPLESLMKGYNDSRSHPYNSTSTQNCPFQNSYGGIFNSGFVDNKHRSHTMASSNPDLYSKSGAETGIFFDFVKTPNKPNPNINATQIPTAKTHNSPRPSHKPHDAFGDLLGAGFNYKPQHTSSKDRSFTLNDMIKRKETIDNLDPIQKRVKDWAEGKQKNIRLLLSTLHDVLWEGETKWNPVTMYNLKEHNDVKLAYKKACLIIHPDKLVGSSEEDLAREIFIELSDAWKIYSQQSIKKV